MRRAPRASTTVAFPARRTTVCRRRLNYNDRKGVDALASVAARRDSARSVSTGGGAVTISVRDANGDPLEAVHVGDRTFVVGQAGQRYSLVLQNHASHRFEAVGTVDGLDVINGKREQLEGKIQERYGKAKDEVTKDVDTWYDRQTWH